MGSWVRGVVGRGGWGVSRRVLFDGLKGGLGLADGEECVCMMGMGWDGIVMCRMGYPRAGQVLLLKQEGGSSEPSDRKRQMLLRAMRDDGIGWDMWDMLDGMGPDGMEWAGRTGWGGKDGTGWDRDKGLGVSVAVSFFLALENRRFWLSAAFLLFRRVLFWSFFSFSILLRHFSVLFFAFTLLLCCGWLDSAFKYQVFFLVAGCC